jgi:maltooligosyltrehalose trehalohydrolase
MKARSSGEIMRATAAPRRTPNHSSRRFPAGAEVCANGVHFQVWAPKHKLVSLELSSNLEFSANRRKIIKLDRQDQGYFSALVAETEPGTFYRIKLPDGSFPDPASRFQPSGPHGPSQIVDPSQFRWTDGGWRGVSRRGRVIYELHIGTFTREGTWKAAQEQLPELARLGVTLIEIMPVAEFAGQFGWGYDGVDLFAPTHLYGTPDEFRTFVDRAHDAGLGVILDVVYNHLGPDGNYLKQFSDDYFTDRYQCEWGEAINFDGENSGPVRDFFTSNAEYWIEEYHLDGLRLDATQQIFDASPNHILAVLSRQLHESARGRNVFLVAENETQRAILAKPIEQGGYGLDALWNDDFHHSARVATTGRNEAYYSGYRGTPQELLSAVKHGFLYQGQWYGWQKQRRGTPAFGLEPEQFISFIQNHDQVANSLRGLRLGSLTSPGRLRAITALLLLGPNTPMLFQGQEFGATAPFHYFADHFPDLASKVAKGRGDLLSQFDSVASPAAQNCLNEPHSKATFLACKLDLAEREKHATIYHLHGDLLKLRREDPVFSNHGPRSMDGAVLGPEALVLRFFGKRGQERLLLVNLGLDLEIGSIPEPLLAPPEYCNWALMWSSEDPCYGGCGTPQLRNDGPWRMPGHAALVLEANQAV